MCPQCHYASSIAGFVRLHAVVSHQGMDDADVVMDDVSTLASSVSTSSDSDVDMDDANWEDVGMVDSDTSSDTSSDISDASLPEHDDGRLMPIPEIPVEQLSAFRTFIPGVGFGTFVPETGLPAQPSSENDLESLFAPLAQLHINSSPFRCTECLLRPVNGRWCEEHNRN